MAPDNGGNGIVEIAVLHAYALGQAGGQGRGGQGAGGQDNVVKAVQERIVQGGDAGLPEGDERVFAHRLRHAAGKERPVHGQGLARRDAGCVGILHEGTVEIAQLLLEQANAAGQIVGAQRVGAHKLGEIIAHVGL